MNDCTTPPPKLAAIAVLIPAWQPEWQLLALAENLERLGFGLLVVIDDGSDPIFRALREHRIHVLRHAVNLGKGRALKTGFNAILVKFPEIRGVVTADADGQHTPADIFRVAEALVTTLAMPRPLPVLGVRGFNSAVPLRSRFGNALTRFIFAFATGTKLTDTQTGLRGLPAALLPELLTLAGERYEYEMTMLADLCRDPCRPPVEVPIATIYLEGNRGSHFNPVRDSMRIYFVLARFYASSILAATVDFLGFSVAFLATHHLLLSLVVGRLSSFVNFALNKRFVFRSRRSLIAALWRYYVLAAAIAALSYGLIWLLFARAGWNVFAAKVLVDGTLSLVSFSIQRTFIFRAAKKRRPGEATCDRDSLASLDHRRLVLIELLSLRLNLLNGFFFDAGHADVQGVDYFSLPKAFLNLTAGRSAYDTFASPMYGPHATWYLSHPFLAVALGSWLSRCDPMPGYGLFTMLSLATMAGCAVVLGRETKDPLLRRLLWLLFLGAFPTYWMLFVGNPQAPVVLALALLFAGLLRITREERAGALLFTGLLLSLLSKPVVLLMLPLLLLLHETRRPAAWATGMYVAVSAVFELVPALNPAAIGLGRVAWLALHPGFVRATMDIYRNQFVLTPDMKDNSIHWFNLIAQSGNRLQHIDVFSLSAFLDTLFRQITPGWVYMLPALAILALSLLIARQKPGSARSEAALFTLLAASIAFFLSYPIVWEYQYTSVLPVAAALLLLRREVFRSARSRVVMIVLALCAWLPGLYIVTSANAVPPIVTPLVLNIIRFDRVIPITVLFVLLLVSSALVLRRGARLTASPATAPSAAPTTPDYSSPAENRA